MKKYSLLIAACIAIALVAMPVFAAQQEATKAQILQGKLNINTATADQLKMLPQIGEKTAAAIVEYRTKHGNFKTVKDLIQVKGIGEKTLEKISEYIILEGKSSLKQQ